jgi:hypothetical protein
MRPLLIDEVAKTEVARVCEYAEENRISNREMKARITLPSHEYCAPGDEPGHVCYFQMGFKCVLTIEEQNAPLGWCKHLSVSVADMERMPHIEAVKLLMKEFGMNKPLEECCVYIEDSSPKSVNVICPI